MSNHSPHAYLPAGVNDDNIWPSVSLLILNWNGKSLLEQYLPSFLELDYPNYQVVVIDNGSTDDSVAFVQKQFPQFTLIEHNENLGFGPGFNLAIQQIESDVIVLLNNDVEVRSNWLRALVFPIVTDAKVGIVGCKLLYPDGKTIQHAGASLSYPLAFSLHEHYQELDDGQAEQQHDVDYVTGAAMAIARPVIDAIGLLDDVFVPYYYEEADYCYRARAAGFRILYVPDAVAIHHESFTMQQIGNEKLFALEKNRLRFVLRHYSPEQFLEDYVPAELDRLQTPLSSAELYQFRRALLMIKLQLPKILQEKGESDRLQQYEAALDSLRHTAILQRPQIYNSMPEGSIEISLAEKQTLEEPVFTSKIPVVGRFVVLFRKSWNAVSTKWYVRAVIQQQMEFNRLLTRLFSEQDRQIEVMEQEIELLTNELLTLQQRLARLEKKQQSALTNAGEKKSRGE
jgi:GT2 family glycosyltransferase